MKYRWYQGNLFMKYKNIWTKYLVPSRTSLFSTKSIRLCGNFYQLPPVQAKSFFNYDEASTLVAFLSVDLWLNFKEADWIKFYLQKMIRCFQIYSIRSEWIILIRAVKTSSCHHLYKWRILNFHFMRCTFIS